MAERNRSDDPPEGHAFPEWIASDTELKAFREDVVEQMGTISSRVDTAVDALDTLGERMTGESIVNHPEYPWSWSTIVPADTPKTDAHEVEVKIEYPGRVNTVHFGWTDAANQAVGVQFRGPDDEKLVPRNPKGQADFISMNNHVLPVDLGFDFEGGSTFTARFVNTDEDNDHYINVVGLVEDRNE